MESQLLSIVPLRRARGVDGRRQRRQQLSLRRAVLRFGRGCRGDAGVGGEGAGVRDSIGPGETGDVQVVGLVGGVGGRRSKEERHSIGAALDRSGEPRGAALREAWSRDAVGDRTRWSVCRCGGREKLLSKCW
eukprot:COSAG02_NODE_19572_length_875_cov_1.284794_1_plen_133_part_00